MILGIAQIPTDDQSRTVYVQRSGDKGEIHLSIHLNGGSASCFLSPGQADQLIAAINEQRGTA